MANQQVLCAKALGRTLRLLICLPAKDRFIHAGVSHPFCFFDKRNWVLFGGHDGKVFATNLGPVLRQTLCPSAACFLRCLSNPYRLAPSTRATMANHPRSLSANPAMLLLSHSAAAADPADKGNNNTPTLAHMPALPSTLSTDDQLLPCS
ncbi:hypothetical protein PtA15_10A376 [Puccinia triticina]|uniref:Uncharacterized protein n=1 Tax=Puccinia triticina TaxID=208348 RepID=A0ABY7CVK5_9BASI|nr:uncharacterized protein PtA15_10A376 [Puccinia triticina]WAQ88953.1 hypothetical protein PtA15_10A376 [Puccinia triticina]